MSPGFLGLERGALGDVWGHKRVIGVQFIGNALLLWAVYAWLGRPDRTVWQLAVSALLALLVLFAAIWLHGTALAAFHRVGQAPGLPRTTLRRLPGLLPWVLAAAALLALVVWLAGYAPRVAADLSSRFTLWLRTPVSPQKVGWVYPALLRSVCLIGWLALLPLASRAVGGGFSGQQAVRMAVSWRYWLACAILVLVGIYLPGRLIWWVLPVHGLFLETLSMLVRFALAYVLVVTAWLTLAAVIGRLGLEGQE
jgi:hypothetical protein